MTLAMTWPLPRGGCKGQEEQKGCFLSQQREDLGGGDREDQASPICFRWGELCSWDWSQQSKPFPRPRGGMGTA